MHISFDKMEGAGNDFILIDNREKSIPDSLKAQLIVRYCRRAQGIGADGMIFIEPDQQYDFCWDFYNSDGSPAEMCGNGARCAARFANKIGAAGAEMTFRTTAGPIEAVLTGRGAKVRLTPAPLPHGEEEIEVAGEYMTMWNVNTGVPHAVLKVEDVEAVDVAGLGRIIRNHEVFAPAGTNVNFFAVTGQNKIAVRTYERGVENETLACGTGTVAACLIAGRFFGLHSPVTALTRSGEELVAYFTIQGDMAEPVFLEGGARLVFSGAFDWEA